ncbi:MAG: electron transport complex subunit RsxC [Dethiobacteria bacterium]|jgi:electron transport complex protein RnfC
MSIKTFKGGVHPGYFKSLTANLPVVSMPLPEKVIIPLQQHIGVPCEPLVSPGDEVKVGQKIGESSGFVSAPIHATISGKVTKIEPYEHPLGRPVQSVFIEADGQDSWHEAGGGTQSLADLDAGEIKKIIREAGIVGLGGAAFPTHVKISPPADKPIDTVIVNGAECEPYLTADHRVMLERSEDVVFGLKAVMKALDCKKGYIGIEDNKPDAIEALREACAEEENIEVIPLHTKYPQGAEKMLIEVITGRQVPSGGLPMDVGVVNQNAGTCVAIAEAIKEGRPLVERVVTVTGPGIEKPANVKVRLGTIVREVIDYCGGMKEDTRKLILGGPMMGLAQPTADIPVIKGTSGILVLTEKEVVVSDIRPCIKCAKCVDVCPVNILPNFLGLAGEQGLIERSEGLNALDCIECGCCTYICPAKRPLTQWIRIAKAEITARRKKK